MSQQALYRLYRPKTFDEIYGQKYITKILKNSVANDTISHAYIFCGPRGTGKTSAARVFAKSVNCLSNMTGNPDNSCPNCLSVMDNKSLDIIEIDAASHTQVDNIREVIIERANFAPVNLKYKIYIIDEAHMLSKSSFNALLKIIEDPPKHTIFIFATTEISKIPTTIVSRCQRFDFKKIDQDTIINHISFIADKEKIKITKEATQLIAKHSDGGFRDAISLLDQISSNGKDQLEAGDVELILGLSDETKIEDYLSAIFSSKVNEALIIIKALDNEGQDFRMFNKSLVNTLHKLLLAKISGKGRSELEVEISQNLRKIAKETDQEKIIETIETILLHEQIYKYSSLPQLGIEVATIKICLNREDKKITKIAEESDHKTEKVASSSDQEVITSKKKPTNNTALWQQLLMDIKSRNNSIHAFLKVCDPELGNDKLCLYFPYKFHKERIEDSKNRELIEASIKRIYGQNLRIECFIRANNIGQKKVENDDLLADALEIFGGEVVD